MLNKATLYIGQSGEVGPTQEISGTVVSSTQIRFNSLYLDQVFKIGKFMPEGTPVKAQVFYMPFSFFGAHQSVTSYNSSIYLPEYGAQIAEYWVGPDETPIIYRFSIPSLGMSWRVSIGQNPSGFFALCFYGDLLPDLTSMLGQEVAAKITQIREIPEYVLNDQFAGLIKVSNANWATAPLYVYKLSSGSNDFYRSGSEYTISSMLVPYQHNPLYIVCPGLTQELYASLQALVGPETAKPLESYVGRYVGMSGGSSGLEEVSLSEFESEMGKWYASDDFVAGIEEAVSSSGGEAVIQDLVRLFEETNNDTHRSQSLPLMKAYKIIQGRTFFFMGREVTG